MANKQKKNPTWFFVAVIAGAGVLLLALFFGLVPEDEVSVNEDVIIEEEGLGETILLDEPEDEVEEFDQPVEVKNAGFALEEDEVISGPDIQQGILSQSYASGGQLVRTSEDMEGIIRHSIGAQDEGSVVIDGVEGMRVSGESAKDGTPVQEIHVKKDGFIYVLSGSDEFLMECINSGKWE